MHLLSPLSRSTPVPLQPVLSPTGLLVVSRTGHAPSHLGTWHMQLSPSSTRLHSQLLIGTQPRVTSSRKPSQPCKGRMLPVVLSCIARLRNCSCLSFAEQSCCWLGPGAGVLAAEGDPLPGMGGRNHEMKVGYLYPRDPVISRIFIFSRF